MSTWCGVLVATASRPDFWSLAAREGVTRVTEGVPPHALIDCGADWDAPMRLAEVLSRDIGSMAIGFAIQTNVDTHHAQVFVNGQSARYLGYDREGEGWSRVEGTPQPWELLYFFDGGSTREGDGKEWPRMLSEEISESDCARYEAAKAAGDATPVLSLLGPSSTAPMWDVVESFGARPDQPDGRWKKPSLWSRWFGASRVRDPKASFLLRVLSRIGPMTVFLLVALAASCNQWKSTIPVGGACDPTESICGEGLRCFPCGDCVAPAFCRDTDGGPCPFIPG